MVKIDTYRDTVSGETLTRKIAFNVTYYYNSNGLIHRTDGPAIINKTYKTNEMYWRIDGKDYTELEFKIQVRKMKMENL